MWKFIAATAVASLGLASAAGAQVIYQPVQSQHVAYGRTYYYGGNNPHVHRYAERRAKLQSHYRATTEPPAVYIDELPRTNARVWGYRPSDAVNAAAGNVITNFRKRDLYAQAERQPDGTWAVPPYGKGDMKTSALPNPGKIAPKRNSLPHETTVRPQGSTTVREVEPEKGERVLVAVRE